MKAAKIIFSGAEFAQKGRKKAIRVEVPGEF
jgi:hypothetical protein